MGKLSTHLFSPTSASGKIFPQTSLSPRVSSSSPLLWEVDVHRGCCGCGCGIGQWGWPWGQFSIWPIHFASWSSPWKNFKNCWPHHLPLGKAKSHLWPILLLFFGVVLKSWEIVLIYILHAVTSFTHTSCIRMCFSFLFHNSRHKLFP